MTIDNRNDLAYWFPLLVERVPHIPVPRTIILSAPTGLIGLVDGDLPEKGRPDVMRFASAIADAGDIVGWPAFLRTGHGSGKHEWNDTCYLTRNCNIVDHLRHLVEWSMCADVFGLPFGTWAVRELLPTRPLFHAFQGMPIVREARFFADNGVILGWQPYWPTDVFWNADEGFERKVPALHAFTDDEIGQLAGMSREVSVAIPGAWSIDWLETDDGWYLTDMADATESFIWHDWPTAPTSIRPPEPVRPPVDYDDLLVPTGETP